ncbi:MAG: hypothetical protein ACFBSG_09085 [Leptolyngbyaceae cyanobacterium]
MAADASAIALAAARIAGTLQVLSIAEFNSEPTYRPTNLLRGQ